MKPFPKKFAPFCRIYARAFRWQICGVLLFSLLAAGLSNLNIRFFSEITGTIKLNDPQSYETAMTFVWLLLICGVLSVIFNQYSQYFFQAKFLLPCRSRMEKDLFSYLLGHSYEYITSKQSGMLIRQKEQVKTLPAMLDRLFWDLSLVFDILVKVVMLTYISPLIGGGYLLCAIIVMFPAKLSAGKVSRVAKANAKMAAMVDGRILDVVNNLALVKQFDNIGEEKKRLHPLMKQSYALKQKTLFVWWGQYNLTGVMTSVMSFILLLTAVYFWQQGGLSTADIVFILMTLTQGLGGLSELQDGLLRFRQNIATVEQGLEPFAEPHGIVDTDKAARFKPKGGKVEFNHLCFGYKGSRKAVFKDFSLTIRAGEKIGITGASGSGKSTLINLLQRAYAPDSGSILIDGQDISKVTQESLKQHISFIPQDTVMFNRSIADNIAFGTDIVDAKKIKKAADKANASAFILEKDGGFDAYAGDKGCLLSGGERQRIAIARAILKNAQILILDEATSALDSESEKLIQNALDSLIHKQTVIAVAHRLSTLKNMDRIIVLDRGKICEEGSFDELIRLGGKFAKLYHAAQAKGGKNV